MTPDDAAAAVTPVLASASAEPAPRGGAAPTFLTPSLALELGLLIALSVLFPFMVHVLPVPEDARLGPRLLPMFYAPLLAALLGRPRSAVAVAGTAPWLNWLITGHPTPPSAALTMVQLLVFVGAVRWLVARLPARWCVAVPAYFASMVVALALALVFPQLTSGRPALGWAAQSVIMGLPGIAVLLLINWFAVRNYPTGGDSGPRTA